MKTEFNDIKRKDVHDVVLDMISEEEQMRKQRQKKPSAFRCLNWIILFLLLFPMTYSYAGLNTSIVAFYNTTSTVNNYNQIVGIGVNAGLNGSIVGTITLDGCSLNGIHHWNLSAGNGYGRTGGTNILDEDNFPNQAISFSMMYYFSAPVHALLEATAMGSFAAGSRISFADQTAGNWGFGVYSSGAYFANIPDTKLVGWTHVAGTYYKNGRITSWANGVLQANNSVPNVDIANNLEMMIGCATNNGAPYVCGKGCIANVGFWNRTLSTAEIQQLNLSLGLLPLAATAPAISAITNRTTTTHAVINWTTDLSSNTSVNYGTSKSLGTWLRTNDGVTAHSKTITGLIPLTKYYFNVSSCTANLCSISGYNVLITKQEAQNLSIIATSPPNNTQRSISPITFRANITSNMTQVNCSFKENGVVKTSQLVNNPITSVSFSRTYSSSQGFNWSINCKFGTKYQANMTTTKLFYYDAVPPSISSPFVNGTAYYVKNLTTTFTLTDDFSLYSYNISIDNVQKERKINLNSTFYQINFSNSITSLATGIHKMRAIVNDGHTTTAISSMETSTGLLGNYLKYTSNKKDITIQNKDGSLFDKFSTTKLTDRYSWTYKPSSLTSSYTFIVEASEKIVIKEAPNTYLKKWLIIGDKRWMDFDISNEAEEIAIKRINTNKVEVTISNIKNPATQVYNSIGELNTYTKEWYFYKVGTSIQYQSLAIETQEITSNLTITRNNTIATSAKFYYDTTEVTPTKISTAATDVYRISYIAPLIASKSLDIPFTWNLTIGTETNRTSLSQKTYQMFIDNCSYNGSSTRQAMEFNTTQEGTTTLLTSNASGQFKVWMGSSPLSRTYNIQWQEANSSHICILPNATLNLDYTLEYKKGGYLTRHKSDFGAALNTTLQKINLPLLPTTSGAAITIALVNNLNQALVNYLIKMNRFDSLTGNYTEVQSEITDVLGYSTFFNYNAATKYRFIIKNNLGVQVYDTGVNGMYLTTSPTTIIVYLAQSPSYLSEYINAWKIRTQLYNKSTVIILKWDTLAGTSGTICMNVTRVYNTSTDYLAGACSISPSGNMTYNFGAYTSGDINAYAYIKGSSIVTNVLHIALDLTSRLFDFIGVDGLLIYILLIVVAAAMTIANIHTLPYGLILAHVASWYLGLIPGSFTIVICIVAALMIIMMRIE